MHYQVWLITANTIYIYLFIYIYITVVFSTSQFLQFILVRLCDSTWVCIRQLGGILLRWFIIMGQAWTSSTQLIYFVMAYSRVVTGNPSRDKNYKEYVLSESLIINSIVAHIFPSLFLSPLTGCSMGEGSLPKLQNHYSCRVPLVGQEDPPPTGCCWVTQGEADAGIPASSVGHDHSRSMETQMGLALGWSTGCRAA